MTTAPGRTRGRIAPHNQHPCASSSKLVSFFLLEGGGTPTNTTRHPTALEAIVRRTALTRRCTDCDTNNSVLRPACSGCRQPMPGVTALRGRAGTTLRTGAEWTDTIGWTALIVLAGAAALQHGTSLVLADLLPALAVYGLAQFAVLALGSLAQAADPGPTWQEAADALADAAGKLTSSTDRTAAAGELNRHGGLDPLTVLLRASALLSREKRVRAQEAGDDQEALNQKYLEASLLSAARELDADVERAWR